MSTADVVRRMCLAIDEQSRAKVAQEISLLCKQDQGFKEVIIKICFMRALLQLTLRTGINWCTFWWPFWILCDIGVSREWRRHRCGADCCEVFRCRNYLFYLTLRSLKGRVLLGSDCPRALHMACIHRISSALNPASSIFSLDFYLLCLSMCFSSLNAHCLVEGIHTLLIKYSI